MASKSAGGVLVQMLNQSNIEGQKQGVFFGEHTSESGVKYTVAFMRRDKVIEAAGVQYVNARSGKRGVTRSSTLSKAGGIFGKRFGVRVVHSDGEELSVVTLLTKPENGQTVTLDGESEAF